MSLDLKDAFPGLKGLSYTNLKYAAQWYRFYNQENINRHQVGGDLEMPETFGLVPWGHHVQIIAKCKVKDVSTGWKHLLRI